jgi:Cft2 family RNA processing exonuclease
MTALTKKAYTAVLGRLKKVNESWLQDRVENPHMVPYEIDCELDRMIVDEARKDGMRVSNRDSEELCRQVKNYLCTKGIIVGSPFGGVMFPLPKDHAPLPSKEQFVENVKNEIDKIIRTQGKS